MYFKPSGSWVAIPTPFDGRERIDFDVFAQLIDLHARHGTSALLALGSCGEATLLSMEERREVIRRVAALAKGKIPIYYGVTSPSTRDTLALAQFAADSGADGLVLTPPPYITPPQEALYQYFETIMGAVQIPCAVYNNPTRVMVNIEPATIARLSERFDHFVADKEAMPRNSQLVEVMELTRGRLHVLCCDAPGYSIGLTTLAMGGHGLANITGNVIPAEMAAMGKPWTSFEGVHTTRELFFRYLPLMRMMYTITNPVVVKAGLRVLGFRVGRPRLPLPDVLPDAYAALTQLLRDLGALDKYALR